jgi:hypothetical protein
MNFKPKQPKANWTQVPGKWKPREKTTRRIKPRTSQRAREEARYRARVKVWLVGKTCDLCASLTEKDVPATQCHHYRGRVGRLLNLEEFWQAMCDSCHQWIHLNPMEARMLGWLAGPGEWNVVPKGEAK